MGLVPATSPCNKSTSRKDQLPVHTMQLVPATCCRDQSQGLVPSCVPSFSTCDQILWQKWPVHTMRLVPSTCCREQSQGLVPSCAPTFNFLLSCRKSRSPLSKQSEKSIFVKGKQNNQISSLSKLIQDCSKLVDCHVSFRINDKTRSNRALTSSLFFLQS